MIIKDIIAIDDIFPGDLLCLHNKDSVRKLSPKDLENNLSKDDVYTTFDMVLAGEKCTIHNHNAVFNIQKDSI